MTRRHYMTKLDSSTRLKVKRDTFFLPDPKGGVYFRNNVNSFRMEGATIYQWIEKLLPLFNGEHTMEYLTNGLTPPYRTRVYEIGETLYKNGFVRDVSKDAPHHLNDLVIEQYVSQIEFIENFMESGAYRFQQYREAKVLAIGSGSFVISMASALLESGLPKFHVMVTDSVPTNLQRLRELVENAAKMDPDVALEMIPFHEREGSSYWKEAVQPYDWIIYVSQDGNIEELRELNQVCKEERKVFLPAICLEQIGLAGPLVHPEYDGCWESAWRRIHHTAVKVGNQPEAFSTIAGSILSNVTVFEFFKRATGIASSNQCYQIYLLKLETLEGNWMSFFLHPLVKIKSKAPSLVEDVNLRLKQESVRNENSVHLLEYFSQITSDEIGIFHVWDEKNLTQLPLAQCCVQAVNPFSEGPAELQPEVVCSGFTHEEAQREAGLCGIEMYVSKLVDFSAKGFNLNDTDTDHTLNGFIGIGAGETFEEAVCRGLQSYLDEELRDRKVEQLNTIFRLKIGTIEDRRCRFYLNALTTLNGVPTIGIEEEIMGFPVIWVRSNGRWYTKAGLNTTLSLRRALQQALVDAQNKVDSSGTKGSDAAVFLKIKESKLEIPSCEDLTKLELLQNSIEVLDRNKIRLSVFDLNFESFLKEELAGVYGVQLQREES